MSLPLEVDTLWGRNLMGAAKAKSLGVQRDRRQEYDGAITPAVALLDHLDQSLRDDCAVSHFTTWRQITPDCIIMNWTIPDEREEKGGSHAIAS
jgi:hypothetical protein